MIWQTLHYPPRAQYSGAFPSLNQIYAKLQALALTKNAVSLGEIEDKCLLVVNQLAQLLTERTGKPCAVCIKTVVEGKTEDGKPRLEAVTLCRDNASQLRQNKTNRIRHHWVDENSDFDQLFKSDPPERYSFSNNLPAERGYKNSSFFAYGEGPPPGRVTFMRWWYWKLPYQSTIVAAISPPPSQNHQGEKVIGFLCVDSDNRHIFLKPYDISIVTGIADCLFEIITRYRTLKSAGP